MAINTYKYRSPQKGRSSSDCCSLASNIVLVISCLVAIVACLRFLTDDPIYEYGEQLLSIELYRQIVFVMIVCMLTLSIPIFLAIKICKNDDSRTESTTNTTLGAKLILEIIIAIFIIICLFFTIPNTQRANLVNQVDYQFQRRLPMSSAFAWSSSSDYAPRQFMSTIQRTYQCCDSSFSRPGYMESMQTMPCYNSGDFIYRESCLEVVVNIICVRSTVLSIALVFMLLMVIIIGCLDLKQIVVPHDDETEMSDDHRANTVRGVNQYSINLQSR